MAAAAPAGGSIGAVGLTGASRFRFAIDRGGTFTDVYAEWTAADGATRHTTLKLLSEDPKNYADAPREGIRRILERETGKRMPREEPVPFDDIESIRMGTTVATNALLERKGARMALLVTKGFRDLLQIGNQSRPRIFDLRVEKPDNLYETVVEVDERLILAREGEELPEHVDASASAPAGAGAGAPRVRLAEVVGTTGERLLVEKAPDAAAVRAALQAVYDSGVRAVAVAFMHSYAYPEHERVVGAIAREVGFPQVSLSSDAMPMVKIVPRGYTACADAYLTPHIVKYVASFRAGFAQGLADATLADGSVRRCGTQLSFMQSDGGLTPVQFFSGHRAILSGPAGGVVGYALTTWDPIVRQPIVAFDMGGTSTDVSRFDGRFEHVHEATIAGITIQAPQLDISTVAAGGGSRLFFRSGLFAVGPESAGAHPGPVCYRKGGYLAVTDANLQLGRIVPESFPHIFGPSEDQPLDVDATRAAFAALGDEVNAFYAASGAPAKDVDEIAWGFLQVANEAMCRPIRALTQMRGFDITSHVLACFGGAGPQHSCAIAKALGMKRIFISKFSGILSAYGISLADVVNEAQAPVSEVIAPHETAAAAVAAERAAAGAASELTPTDLAFACAEPRFVDAAVSSALAKRLQGLAATVSARLLGVAGEAAAAGSGHRFREDQISLELFVNLRYRGTDTAIMVPAFIEAEGEEAAAAAAASAAAGGEGEGEGEGLGRAPHQLSLAAVLGSGFTAATAAAHAAASEAAAAAADFDASARATVAAGVAQAVRRFLRAYQREFGFVLQARDVLVDDVRVRGIARGRSLTKSSLPRAERPDELPAPVYTKSVYFGGRGRVATPVYALGALTFGHRVAGPAMLIDRTSTVVVEPGCIASVTEGGDVEVVVTPDEPLASAAAAGGAGADAAAGASAPSSPASGVSPLVTDVSGDAFADVPADPIQLSIFSHRFMGIAEQMGRVLQRTSISVNMRERLDYSCALFGPDGGLVANAPHIPVHLGAMQEAVKFQVQHWGSDLADGDVLVSNHPQLAGGSHLPDITVITPVFSAGKIVFFVAARGHHADIGGIAPGSMPPMSKSLAEEGAAIVAFKLVQGGVFNEAGITELLMAPGKSGVPGCAGSRNLKDCLSDLKAQVAANHKGIQLVRALIAEYGLRTVIGYMKHIQAAAEVAVREMLVRFSLARGLPPVGTVRAVDFMDDGTPIALAITVDREKRSARFDFTGTGPQVYGNTNAPRAVTYSAIIYSLRCLVGADVPLNQGCLAPVDIHIPEGTILHPSPDAAVVGGNVLTSQRVVDVILRAFGAAAASQGCMNNLTMGNDTFGFYETIAGGSGAGPSWNGRSGVQSHMTNTRATDPEIFERRYPVVLRANTLRSGSGGAGAYKGGEGVYRVIQFRIPLLVSILSERRTLRPYGLEGGGAGARGVNSLMRADGRQINLGGKATVAVAPGDLLRIETPGGGGFGRAAGAAGSAAAAAGSVTAAAAEGEREADEYARAYGAATGAAPPTLPGAPAVADVVGGVPGAGADPAAYAFSGSVGRYKETQESV